MPDNLDVLTTELTGRLLAANAEGRTRLVQLHNLAQARERGIDISRGITWRSVGGRQWATRNHGKLAQWAQWGKPHRIAIGYKLPGDEDWTDLDPPIILDDPASLTPWLPRE